MSFINTSPSVRRFCSILACVVGGTFGSHHAAAQPLVRVTSTSPRVVQDSMGFQWDISPIGTVVGGTNRCMNNAGTLVVNGTALSVTKRSASADGSVQEFSGQAGAIPVTRRVHVDVKTATLRYADTFTNPDTKPVVLNVQIASSLRTSVGAVVTNTGRSISTSGSPRIRIGSTLAASRSNVPVLGAEDCGLLAMRSSTSYPAVLFYLAAPKSRLKPTLQRSGSYSFIFHYSVTVPARRSVSLVHGLAQRNVRGTPNPAELEGHFAPFLERDWLDGLPPDVRRSIVNSDRPTFSDQTPGSPIQAVLDLASAWDVERGATDVLVNGEKNETLRGDVRGGGLKVSTRFGTTEVPLDDMAMLIGGAGIGRPMRVHLRNGEVLVGDVSADDLAFESDLGIEIKLLPKQIGALFRRVDSADGVSPEGAMALARTVEGEQMILRRSPVSFQVTTGWGPVDVPIAEVAFLYPVREPQPMHRLMLRDGSRLSVILFADELEVDSTRFGAVKLNAGAIARMSGIRKPADDGQEDGQEADGQEAEGPIDRPHFRLLGGNLLVGQPDAAALELLTDAGLTPVDAGLVAEMERADEEASSDSPRFSFRMLNGTRLVGRFRDGVVPLRAMDKSWKVPAFHVLSFRRSASDESEPEGTSEVGRIRWFDRRVPSRDSAPGPVPAGEVLSDGTNPDGNARPGGSAVSAAAGVHAPRAGGDAT